MTERKLSHRRSTYVYFSILDHGRLTKRQARRLRRTDPYIAWFFSPLTDAEIARIAQMLRRLPAVALDTNWRVKTHDKLNVG